MTRTLISKSSNSTGTTLKFLYSYNGQIIPRRSDGSLRYVGGFTRVLSVDRSISYAELMVKFGELCGTSMSLKCKLPNEDLDVLISIKSDADLRNVIGEYDRLAPETKIRAVLFPITSLKKISPPSSPMSCVDFTKFQQTNRTAAANHHHQSQPFAAAYRYGLPPFAVGYPAASPPPRKEAVRVPQCCHHGSPRQLYFAPYNYSNYHK